MVPPHPINTFTPVAGPHTPHPGRLLAQALGGGGVLYWVFFNVTVSCGGRGSPEPQSAREMVWGLAGVCGSSRKELGGGAGGQVWGSSWFGVPDWAFCPALSPSLGSQEGKEERGGGSATP